MMLGTTDIKSIDSFFHIW